MDEDEYFIDWFIEQQPELTEEESKQKMVELEKCADFILKNGLTPNLDSIY